MIELTEQQIRAMEDLAEVTPRLLNPFTNETFVLIRADEYKRLKENEYDDTPWTKEELQALAWEMGTREGWENEEEKTEDVAEGS